MNSESQFGWQSPAAQKTIDAYLEAMLAEDASLALASIRYKSDITARLNA